MFRSIVVIPGCESSVEPAPLVDTRITNFEMLVRGRRKKVPHGFEVCVVQLEFAVF